MSTAVAIRSRAATWWIILRICVEERLVYRGDFALGTLMRFMPIVTQVFLWGAIFTGAGRSVVAGFTENEIVAYYLLTMISRAFSSMPGLASGIARQIRSGEIKKFMIQPIDMVGFLLLSRVAHKLVYYVVAIAPFALVFFVCRGYFSGWPDPATMAAFVASLVMAFLLGFFLEATIGMIGFWFLEVSSLLFVYMLFSFFLSGHMFPIGMLPDGWRQVVEAQPLQYLAYFPAVIFLGKVRGMDLVRGLVIEALWVVLLAAICKLSLHRGFRRYSGYGG
ncbi:MAG TPA: ABC-2 family transporter protein [Pirellulales bacterium]|jgi:ABC-2 type transport system permease protein|nr:ABC-2 family transporter protein [Pirellulales bacterium]